MTDGHSTHDTRWTWEIQLILEYLVAYDNLVDLLYK